MTATPICLVGLPGAGKTTFLAAFWAASRDAVGNGFKIVEFPDDPVYLQKIADEWFKPQRIERNSSSSWEPIQLHLRSAAGVDLLLRIPDLSGEAFRDAAADRQIDPRVSKLIEGARFVLFFLNAATASVPISLADLGAADEPEQSADRIMEFDPKALETDILNAELLQLLPLLTAAPERPPPLAVIVSAWDEVDGLGLDPKEWLETNQPMFAQVLAEYGRRAATNVIGISAQGADYSKDSTVAHKPPAQRPLVVAEVRSTDIGTPFAWFEQLTDSDHGE